MAEDIKGLIEKIQQEGISVADEKAAQIEQEAKQKAAQILSQAKQEADKVLAEAEEKISRMEEKDRVLLSQAGRDLILSLKQEINNMLMRLVSSSMHEALRQDVISKIMLELVKCASHHKEDIIITLSKEEIGLIEKDLLHKLKEEAKKGVTLKPSQDIRAGFTISFDAGKSCFDFSDKALAEYISQYLKPKLAEILNGYANKNT